MTPTGDPHIFEQVKIQPFGSYAAPPPPDALRTAMQQASYYARRAGFLEGALMLIALGYSDIHAADAAKRALAAVDDDEHKKE
jgi:hypothetical protein